MFLIVYTDKDGTTVSELIAKDKREAFFYCEKLLTENPKLKSLELLNRLDKRLIRKYV